MFNSVTYARHVVLKLSIFFWPPSQSVSQLHCAYEYDMHLTIFDFVSAKKKRSKFNKQGLLQVAVFLGPHCNIFARQREVILNFQVKGADSMPALGLPTPWPLVSNCSHSQGSCIPRCSLRPQPLTVSSLSSSCQAAFSNFQNEIRFLQLDSLNFPSDPISAMVLTRAPEAAWCAAAC